MGTRGKKQTGQDPVILVPTDFSAVGEYALLHGLEIARAFGGRVILLHVINSLPDTILNKEDPGRLKIREDLQRCKDTYEPLYNIPVDPLVREGNLFVAFNKVAASVKPALMVMGTHGKQGLQHLYGSHALRVVLGSPCPVMIVQEPPAWREGVRILLPVNGETDPGQVILWVLQLATLEKPAVHLLVIAGAGTEHDKQARTNASVISERFKQEGIACTSESAVSANDLAAPVTDRALSGKYNLVITMAMPAAGASGLLFQGWNERLMFNPAKVPVLFLVHPEPAP
jgi:nucleotide-binding universal stress UspA family protein